MPTKPTTVIATRVPTDMADALFHQAYVQRTTVAELLKRGALLIMAPKWISQSGSDEAST